MLRFFFGFFLFDFFFYTGVQIKLKVWSPFVILLVLPLSLHLV